MLTPVGRSSPRSTTTAGTSACFATATRLRTARVWVTVTGDQASLSLEDRSTSTGSQVIRTEAVGLDDAPRVFTEMVGTLGAGLVPAVLPAQEVFKRLLRDYVRPALGADGSRLPARPSSCTGAGSRSL